jgi:uncharacterized membrane protein
MMARLYSIRPSWTIRGRKFQGIRGWTGKPAHPPLTDFPIVCYILTALFDVVSKILGADNTGKFTGRDFQQAATFVLAVGFVVSLGTAITGFWDWWKGLDRDRSTGIIGRAQHTQVWRTANWHMTIMLTTTAIVIIDLIVRWGEITASPYTASSTGATILSVIAALLVAFGAGYGGEMVFEYQFNVESLKGSTVWDETDVDQFPGDQAKPAQSSGSDAPPVP